MMILTILENIFLSLFFCLYLYQFFYIFLSFFTKSKKVANPAPPHHLAILIAARNEQSVIGELLESIAAQEYPASHVHVFVVADNCTDQTATIAMEHGATVFIRHHETQIGKGYALQFLLKKMQETTDINTFDAFLVFDADNVLSPYYLYEMNQTFSEGYAVVTGYRNSKNYGDNWLSAGYALNFLRESRYLNRARMLLHQSCIIGGTGFLFSRSVLERCGGWHYVSLCEDIEFTSDIITQGEIVGYCEKAVLYDEQPTKFSQSCRQRLRWSKGFLLVLRQYGFRLFRGTLHKSFSCYDMLTTLLPTALFQVAGLLLHLIRAILVAQTAGPLAGITCFLLRTISTFAGLYLSFLSIGALTTFTEWKQIHTSARKKLLFIFTYPIFNLSSIPIFLVALFRPVVWQPIHHSRRRNLQEILTDH